MNLFVEFKQGRVYRYYPVPEDIANGFTHAIDSNDYFVSNIKFQYQYERVS